MVFLLTFVTIIYLTNSQSYYLSRHKRTWSDASNFCINTCGSTLATIGSSKAAKITTKLIEESDAPNEPIWIGLIGNEWIDKTEYKYTQLLSDTSINNKCSVITPENEYKWTPQDCSSQQEYRFFCNSCDGILHEDSESNNEWTIIAGDNNALTFDPNNENIFTINSNTDHTIAIINEKQWKQCNKYRPWIVEMKYNYKQQEDYNIGYVFYNNKKSETDHYFIRVKSTQSENIINSESISTQSRTIEISLGYINNNNREIIALGHILNFAWTDTFCETLKVEIEYGLRFVVYLNNKLLLKTGFNKNPFHITKDEVMSGYVGVESLYSNIKINQFIVSGSPLKDNNNNEEWVQKDCIFKYDPLIDDEIMEQFMNQEIKSEITTKTPSEIEAMNMHPDMDVLPDTGDINTFDMRILMIIALIAILCCMIFVGIYYIKMKRDRRKKLETAFGKHDNVTVSIDIEESQLEAGKRVTLPEGGFISTHNSTIIDMNLDAPQPIGIDMDIGRPSLDQFQFSDVQIDNFEQYNTYQPKNSWDIAAIEANCNDIIKHNKGRHSRRHSFT
eukprot:514899_1